MPTWCSLGKIDVLNLTLASKEAISRISSCDLQLIRQQPCAIAHPLKKEKAAFALFL